jgi:hypothetical protein
MIISALGCSRLNHEDNFFKTFKQYSSPIPLTVDYPGYP